MPEMMEIYQKFAENYDELIAAEDVEKNLDKTLLEKIIWNDRIVYEAGIGTGRITKIYIDKVKHCYGFDRAEHMIQRCNRNLSAWTNKVTFGICDNMHLTEIEQKADIFIEGWSFGHTIIENSDNFEDVARNITSRVIDLVKHDGTVVIVETAGTNSNIPFELTNGYLNMYYELLEHEYGFEKTILSTDYLFSDYEEAARILGFFFGPAMEKDIMKTKKIQIPEFTGVWILQK